MLTPGWAESHADALLGESEPFGGVQRPAERRARLWPAEGHRDLAASAEHEGRRQTRHAVAVADDALAVADRGERPAKASYEPQRPGARVAPIHADDPAAAPRPLLERLDRRRLGRARSAR